MKNLFLSLMALVLTAFTVNAQNITDIGKDRDFTTYIKNNDEFLNKARDFVALNKINADGQITQDELPTFYTIFSTNEASYRTFLNGQKILLASLNTKYRLTSYSQNDLNTLLGPPFTAIYNAQATQAQTGTTCYGRYVAMVTLAASVAIGAHYACVPLYAAGGFGGLICDAAVLAGQAAANYLALGSYEDCIASGHK
jgi:hypothetical protein